MREVAEECGGDLPDEARATFIELRQFVTDRRSNQLGALDFFEGGFGAMAEGCKLCWLHIAAGDPTRGQRHQNP